MEQAFKPERKLTKPTQPDGIALAGIPSEKLKSTVLETVYHMDGIKVLNGYQFLAAQHRTTNVGIFVVAGNFGRDHFKKAISEAKGAGLNSSRIYVYGQTATYSGRGIDFNKFEHIGIKMEQANGPN